MHQELLTILRCPYCGCRLSVVENRALQQTGPRIDHGVLGCECCAFPIIAGIPVLIADDTTRSALHVMEAGRPDEALLALLGLAPSAATSFAALRAASGATTFVKTLALLSHDAEAHYLAYRLSDPGFLTSEATVRALGLARPQVGGRALDVCGGAGHLTRVLASLAAHSETDALSRSQPVLVDRAFWKLWLAATFTSPDCAPVCCDANHPLPFVRETFSTVLLSDAFPYIWHKRLLADELVRLSVPEGVVVMPHLHNAHGTNFSAGDTLTPSAYRDLFAAHRAQLFSDRRLFDDLVTERCVDLTRPLSPDEIGDEPTLTLVASPDLDVFRRYELSDETAVRGELRINPLYTVEQRGETAILTLRFPTSEYAEEFADCRQYLPDSVTVRADLTGPLTPSVIGPDSAALRRRRILLDVPRNYC